jgi:hypothetical protein
VADDKFTKPSRTALETVAKETIKIGAVALCGTGAGVLGAVVAATGIEWFRGVMMGNDENLREARVSELEDDFRKLDERVRKLEAEAAARGDIEPPWSPLTQNAVYSDFARAVAEAPTPEKREALVNAAAHLRDPSMGDPSTRWYWWNVVKGLSDTHLAALRWIGTHSVAKGKEPGQYARGKTKDVQKTKRVAESNSFPDDGSVLEIDLPIETAIAFEAVLTEMTFSENNLFAAARSSHGDRILKAGDTLTLSARGQIVLRMISDP